MMTPTQICNLALAKIGATLITSIDSTTSKEAIHAKLHFDIVRDQILGEHPWQFANRTATLDPITGWESMFWQFAHAMPADCIRTLSIYGHSGSKVDRFARGIAGGQQAILNNQAPSVFLNYTSRVTDASQYDPGFVSCLATLLGSRLARAITGSDQLEQTLLAQYMTVALPEARFRDAQETASNENRRTVPDILAGGLNLYDSDEDEIPTVTIPTT